VKAWVEPLSNQTSRMSMTFSYCAGIAVAQEVAVGQFEPGVAAAVLDGVEDAAVDRLVHQRDAGLLVDEHGQGRAPGALAADQPVGTGLDHRADAVAAGVGVEGGLGDGLDGHLAQGLAAQGGHGLVHADEPLRGVAEDHRGLGAPAVRIAVLDAAAGQQVSGLDQLVHDRAVGGPELAGLLALGLDDLQAREQRHVREIGAVGIDGVGDGVQRIAALQPDQIVVGAVARGGVDEAGAGVVGHVVAGQQGHVEAVAFVELSQRVGADQARRIDRLGAAPLGDLGGLADVLGQLVGDDQAVADLGPRGELEVLLEGLDLVEAVLDLGVEADRPVGRDGPRGGGPDHDAGVVGRQAEDVVAGALPDTA
jgi:hypothetical protein